MHCFKSVLFSIVIFSSGISQAQVIDSAEIKMAFIYNEDNLPLPWTHIINLKNGHGSICDSSGRFFITAAKSDSILFRNLTCKDKILIAGDINKNDTIRMQIKLYPINELKVYEWGSTYADFRAKFKSLPVTQDLGEKLGLPVQHGNPIPNFRNEDVLSNPLFAYTNPIDFLYYNYNKKEQSIRKVMEFKKNEGLIRRFESVYNRSSVARLTDLKDKELDDFMVFLNENFKCDFNCSEFQIVNEIYSIWEKYRKKAAPTSVNK